ncbi:MAG: protein ImuA [Sphingomonadaceae bacterium]|nr:protein ImuA [Sphingomonadaceae bacterium]
MLAPSALPALSGLDTVAKLREAVVQTRSLSIPSLPFGIGSVDDRLASGGVDGGGLHEIAAGSSSLTDDAAATLFLAGIAARYAAEVGQTVCWAMTVFDLYAPGLEQVGIGPEKLLYAQGRKDVDVLAIAEDALRDGSLACVIAEVKSADMTATRRLQLAASDGQTPMLLYRRHRTRDRCPLSSPSAAMTRWRISCVPSERLPCPGVGRPRWQVELVRQRNGDPFSLELEACDATGRLALPATSRNRAAAPRRADARDGAISRAA